jgi:hypothetical protein
MNRPPVLNNFIIGFLSVIGIVMFVSCKPDQAVKSSRTYFFDTKAYFDSWVTEYGQSNAKLKKTIVEENAIAEEKDMFLKEVDWKKELSLFYECNINKAALKDAYRTDTIVKDSLRLVQFLALDSASAVRRIDILEFQGEEHPAFAAVLRTDNLLFKSQTLLHFHPNKRYSVQIMQEIKHSGIKREYKITGVIY